MLCRLIFGLIGLGLIAVPSFSQKPPTLRAPAISAEQKERELQIRNQALFLLRDNLGRAKSISVLGQRSYVVVEASSALWDFDKLTAENYLVGFINQWLADYKDLLAKERRTKDQENSLHEVRDAIRLSLRAYTQKDPKSAALLRSKYFKIREDVLKTRDLSEEMEMTAEGLGVDEQRTAAELMAIIGQGIPDEFPRLINTLKTTKPAVADSLIQRAIQNIAVNPRYKAYDAINLSAVIFNENQYPIPLLSDPVDPNNWGTMMFNSLQIKNPPEREVISSFLFAVQGFFNSRVTERSAGVFDSNVNLLQACYLLEKLKAYAVVYNMNGSEMLERCLIPVVDAMRTGGFSDQSLTEIKKGANLQATKNSPVDLDDGSRAFDKADEAKTPEEKMMYLVEGIIGAIDFHQYEKAEWKIPDVANAEIRDGLYLFLNWNAAGYAIYSKNWSDFEKRAEKISDKRIKGFLYIKAITGLEKTKNSRSLLTEYVIKAEKNINDIPDKTAKASALMAMTSSLFSFENVEIIRDVPSAVAAVNESSDYAEDSFEITVDIPKRSHYVDQIGANSFRNVFTKLAESDWTNVQVQALQVKRAGLQAIAQVTAAKSVLSKKPVTK